MSKQAIFLRLSEVCSMVGLRGEDISDLERRGVFPTQLLVGGLPRWMLSEVQEFMLRSVDIRDEELSGKSRDDIAHMNYILQRAEATRDDKDNDDLPWQA